MDDCVAGDAEKSMAVLGRRVTEALAAAEGEERSRGGGGGGGGQAEAEAVEGAVAVTKEEEEAKADKELLRGVDEGNKEDEEDELEADSAGDSGRGYRQKFEGFRCHNHSQGRPKVYSGSEVMIVVVGVAFATGGYWSKM